MLEQQINKLAALLGISKLNESTQDTIKSILSDLITEDGEPIPKIGELLKNLGADKLPEDTQKQLIEKLCIAVVHIRENLVVPKDVVMKIKDFKWDNYSSTPNSLNEVKKSDYKWKMSPMSGDSVLLEDNTKKISKSDYKWGPHSNSIGSGIQGGIIEYGRIRY